MTDQELYAIIHEKTVEIRAKYRPTMVEMLRPGVQFAAQQGRDLAQLGAFIDHFIDSVIGEDEGMQVVKNISDLCGVDVEKASCILGQVLKDDMKDVIGIE